MKLFAYRIVLSALTLGALTGCDAGSSGSPNNTCNGSAIPTMALVYPAPGATGVPDGNFTLVIGSSFGIVGTIGIAGNNLAAASVPSPLPSPYATPQPQATVSAYAVPPLAGGKTYTVVDSIAAGTPCAAQQTVGQFTTQ
jgi:hypothetical protein